MTVPAIEQDAAMPTVDIIVQSDRWAQAPDAEPVLRRAIAAAAAVTATHRVATEVAVVLTDDAGIRALNRQWRGIDAPTNVLSFPSVRAAGVGAPAMLGDIVIAYDVTAAEAAVERKRFADHLAHLAVHGFLHLLGYDHESDDAAEAMERIERAILARLGIADPYLVRDAEVDVDRHA